MAVRRVESFEEFKSGIAIEKTSPLSWQSWRSEESQIESCEHQDNADIHDQSFPESVSEEQDIYADYNGCHRYHVKHDSYLSAHFSAPKLAIAVLIGRRDTLSELRPEGLAVAP
jgi:hypothetical protein